jgi:two-component system sensor histidine kinase PhcS
MAETTFKTAGNELRSAFLEFDRGLRVRQAKLAYALGLLLIPTGWMLDYFVYPTLLWPHLKIRIICDIMLIPCLVILFSKWGQKHARITDKGCTIIPMLAVCWMIFTSEGALSPYYAGLNFTLVGACLVLPYTFKEGAWFTVFVMMTYAAACLCHATFRPLCSVDRANIDASGSLAANMYFLLGNGMICATACHYRFLRRFEDFRLRHELAVNNKELASTLKKLQETEVQLVQSEKMNALGKLSAGLLHEINNPLNFTFMALQMAEQEAGENEDLKDTLKDIGQGMTRIRGVISDLRTFAYPTKADAREEFKLDDALTNAIRLTTHELGDIPVNNEGLDFGTVIGGKTQIIHVFMNLLVNSAQALKSIKEQRKPVITVSAKVSGERAQISVQDNGTGVKKDHLPRLLDPFFTTKDVGQGMGLGLSICHTIIKNHGGQINIESEEGQWTRVTFDLPLASSGFSKSLADEANATSAFKDSSPQTSGSIAA